MINLSNRSFRPMLLGLAFAGGLPATAMAAPRRMVTFAINVQDWLNIEESAETLRFALDCWEEAGVRGQMYFTAPYLEALVKQDPKLVERIRDSKTCVCYHIRPPHPLVFPPTRPLLQKHSVRDYETYKMDLATGDLDLSQPGGYAYVKQVFGRPPVSIGGVPPSEECATVFREIGARMGLGEHGPSATRTGIQSLQEQAYGLYPRPVDYFLARTNAKGETVPDSDRSSNFWWHCIANRQYDLDTLLKAWKEEFLEAAPPPGGNPSFCIVIIHENDFYLKVTPWSRVYYKDERRRTEPLSPPYDLNRRFAPDSRRSAEEKSLIRFAYKGLVQAAALAQDTAVVTAEDIVALADGLAAAADPPADAKARSVNPTVRQGGM